MLFGYALASTAENWLHESLVEMVTTIHADLAAGNPNAGWPDIIPVAHREALRRRFGLRDRLNAYRTAVATLTSEQRLQIATCLVQQNRIHELCRCEEDCEQLDQLPAECRAPLDSLFGYAFDLLTKIGIRDRHYAAIYNRTLYHVCPFCGCEYFDAPGAPREDLDHYLPKSRYPFAAANLRNLVPMGMRCNERYKVANDILRDEDGHRWPVFDPYAAPTVSVSLTDSVPFAGEDGTTPDWSIAFEPDVSECVAWDKVFHVRERLKRDVLDTTFLRWLGEFSSWFKRRIGVAAPDSATVQGALLTYAEDMELLGLNAREFLRAPVFRMLYHHCANGNDRLNVLMTELVSAS